MRLKDYSVLLSAKIVATHFFWISTFCLLTAFALSDRAKVVAPWCLRWRTNSSRSEQRILNAVVTCGTNLSALVRTGPKPHSPTVVFDLTLSNICAHDSTDRYENPPFRDTRRDSGNYNETRPYQLGVQPFPRDSPAELGIPQYHKLSDSGRGLLPSLARNISVLSTHKDFVL